MNFHVIPPQPQDKIAIIGIGCRFPGGASDHRAFWRNLIEGKDCLSDTPASRYDIGTLASRDKTKPGRLVGGRGGYIDDFDTFDPAFFGISPREAHCMDPQQRKLLEVAWEALEDGGQKPGELAGQDVGVFVGGFTLDYKIVQFSDLSFETLAAHTATGTMMTMLSNRLSHCFDFRGPSMSIDTACSSSLVAVHVACQSLRSRESSLALAGGVLLHMAPQYTIAETKGGFLSTEGRSCTFDASANGYVRAEGVGLVVLKRLNDALRDGDPIHAVLIASGVNQDGHTNGITVPNPDAQVHLIQRVCAQAGVLPGSLQYIEAHGTSTPVGDPIEAKALGQALAIGRQAGSKCYVGSVKTNIGHTEAAAGVASLIKVALSLSHRKIPPHINLQQLSPAIDAASLPYEIPTVTTDWPAHEGPARAGVNAFGFGGTNAHVLLEEAPPRPDPVAAQMAQEATTRDRPPQLAPWRILPITARHPAAFQAQVQGIRQELARGGDEAISLEDLGHTLALRRQHLSSRLSFVYDSRAALEARLAEFQDGVPHAHILTGEHREGQGPQRLVWVFTGMGPQWWAMGRQLFEKDPVYREMITRCDREIARCAGWSLIDGLNASEGDSQMAETWLAQPANFAVQVALAAMWRARGVQPDAIVGHSTGEVAAFHEAGVYTLEEAVRVVVHRSRLQQTLVGTGGMLAVGLSEGEALQRIQAHGGRVSIAAVNSPGAVTLAGDEDALTQIAAELNAQQVFAKRLAVRVPYHSAKMDLIKEELLSSLADLRPRPSQVPLYTTGQPGIAQGDELGAAYWWCNVRNSVGFQAAIDLLLDAGHDLFLEIGPHPVLANAIKECASVRGLQARAVPSIRREEDEAARIACSLAMLHNLGVLIDWRAQYPQGRILTLPCYAWQRERYWVEPKSVEQVRLGQLDHPLLGRRTVHAEPAWALSLDVERMPYLNDHRIQGNALFPAAGYIEMAMQAVRAITGGGTATLADIAFRKALFVPEGEACAVQFAFSSDCAGFHISTASPSGQERVVCASGTVRTGQPQPLRKVLNVPALQARALRHLNRPDCYEALAGMGYHYGPAFQGMTEVWVGQKEALARIEPTADVRGDARHHHLHPTMLDACFQALLTPQILQADASANDGQAADTGIRLPLSLAELRTEAIGDQALWAHATVTHEDQDELRGDITLYADDGRALGHLTGLRAANVEKASAQVGLPTIDGWLAELQWVELPADAGTEDAGTTPSAPAIGIEAPPPGQRVGWLIFADTQGVGDQLAALAAAHDEPFHLVRPGQRYKLSRDRMESTVQAGSAADLQRLFTELGYDKRPAFDHIVHLWNLDLPTFDGLAVKDLHAHSTTGSYALIALAQVLSQMPYECQLDIVTRGTQAVHPGEQVEPLGASAWGIGRVLRHQELVNVHGKLIDLDIGGKRDAARTRREAEALWQEVLRPRDEEDEIALRGARRYASRLQPAAESLRRPLPLRLRTDGAYLVTGAFGALGRLLCRTLAKRGARKLILVGRGALPDRAQWRQLDPATPQGDRVRFIKELETLGTEPILAPLDITDEAALQAWLADYRLRDLPPIRGVFHLAGQVRDTLIAQMDRETFDTVHDPKVIGACLLHRYLADEPLEHFVLFASIAALLTTAGQTNYAAGNAFLDALAHHRRARGLSALSLDWGPWATGMIEELGLIAHYRQNRGMSSLSPDAGMDVLERVIGQDRAQLLVATVVDWPSFLAWYTRVPPLVRELAHQGATQNDAGQDSFLDSFRAADASRQQALVAVHFARIVAHVLRIKEEQVNADASLSSLGLDSLLAMELRARVLTDMKVALPMVALLSGGSVANLGMQLHNGLLDLVASADEGDATAAPIDIHEDENYHPLTQNQQALWFLKQLNPDGFAYNIGGAVEVRTVLKPDLMFEAVRILIARHASLRANFVLDKGRPMQRTGQAERGDIALFDVQGQPWADVYQMIIREYRKPYDLENDPLFRFRLFKRAEDHWVIMKAVHHIVSDAISTFTFIDELFAVYEALGRGERLELAPVPSRYLDFLNWQNRFLASRDACKMLSYWQKHLPADVPVLALPTDKPRPVVQTHNGASHFFALDPELSQRIHSLGGQHHVTVFMVLLATYYVLLNRYTGQDDIIVGSPVTGRTQKEFESVYGYFVNPLPLHVNLANAPSVSELLAQVQKTVLNGLDNQEYPFVLLVDKLGLRHDPSRSAVFQTMFILLSHKVLTQQYGYRLEYVELPEEEGQFDLTLSVYEDEAEGRFHCVFKYNTDIFLADTVARIARHYVNLLEALTVAPDKQPVSLLPMLDVREQHLIEDEWSGAGRIAPHDALPVHALIDRACARHPHDTAVMLPALASSPTGNGPRRLSYGELVRRANQRAHALRDMGIGPGDVVALCLPKSPDLIVALLAVLKAGAAYVPLDPGYPAERLVYMLTKSGARLALVETDLHARLSGWSGDIASPDDHSLAAGDHADATPPPLAADMNAPAYIIFTSGSTGQPKAVQVNHGHLAATYAAWRDAYRLEQDVHRHLQMASFSFDVFTGDLVRALCSGGTLVLVTRDLLFDTARLYQTMQDEEIDCAEFVPAVARTLMAHCDREHKRLDFMRLLIVGSDVWKVGEHQRLRSLCGPRTRVVNSYGLSETTIDNACFEGPVDELDPSRMVPIGRPLPNNELHILDPHGQPVPAGITGELWVGGQGVSAGYLGDARQTAQRFVTRTVGHEDEARPLRLYRTGDLARWDAQGCVHLLGRADQQVKVRGHRVEIGEIETHLAAWPTVAQAVVTLRHDARGEPTLCAYGVAAPGQTLAWRPLREHLAACLPTFMIPAHFITLARMPLSPNGKVDLDALPAPDLAIGQDEQEPPVTLFEQRMAAHWVQVLGLEAATPGLQQDFFEIGGSSIKLIELIYQLQVEFNIAVPVSELFKVTTLRGMAKTVENISLGKVAGAQPYLRFNVGHGDRIFCFPPAGGHGLVYRQLSLHLPEFELVSFNYLVGDDKVQCYADLMEAVQNDGHCVLFGYSLGGNLAFEVAKELERRGRVVPHVVIIDSYRIPESFEPGNVDFEAFERELTEHVRKHIGSERLAEETLQQAKDYIHFVSRTPNIGVILGRVSVISDEDKLDFYAVNERGTWHGSSATRTDVFKGHGKHADMLDQAYVGLNAVLARQILATGQGVADAA